VLDEMSWRRRDRAVRRRRSVQEPLAQAQHLLAVTHDTARLWGVPAGRALNPVASRAAGGAPSR
jgi:hypothetical protein